MKKQNNALTGPVGGNEILRWIFEEEHVSMEDARQEAALMVLRRRKKPINLAHGRAMYAYAIREARRNERRQQKYSIGMEELATAGKEPVAADDVHKEAEMGEVRRAVARSLRHLSRQCRAVVMLRFFGCFTRRYIADKLGISMSEVCKCERSAYAALRCLLVDFAPVPRTCEDFRPLFGESDRK
jgi:RNA polymerase sigma factor (sigma-70 family)